MYTILVMPTFTYFLTTEDKKFFVILPRSNLFQNVILESKPHPVASDASDASFVVIFDAHRNFSDYKYLAILLPCIK